MPSFIRCLTIAVFAAFPFVAFPAFAGNAVDIQIVTNVLEGQGEAGIKLLANDPVKNAVLHVNGPEGSRTLHSGEIRASGECFLSLRKQAGRANYSGTLSVELEDGTSGEMPIRFELVVLDALKVSIPESSVDVTARKFTLEASRPIAGIEYTLISQTGEILERGEKSGAPGRRDLPFTWSDFKTPVIRIDFTVRDTDGAFSNLVVSPWSVEMEHEEVNFPTASAEILPAEAPKLDRAYEHIEDNVKRYGKLIHLNLYIAGYTDTVGKPDYNEDLSTQRAKSIAMYFKKKGFRFPIYYQGFGERVLAVATPDNTDEARNRRALYILGGDYRPRGPQLPSANWVQVQ